MIRIQDWRLPTRPCSRAERHTRQRTRRTPAALLALLASLLLSACATVDQTVSLAPLAPALGERVTDAGAVALEVVDRREDQALGAIEAVEGQDARILADGEIAYPVQLAAARALQSVGFRPTLWSDDADPRLLIEIESIRHTVSARLPREVQTEVRLNARAWHGGRRYSANATATATDRAATRPSAEMTGEAIDSAITQALRRLLGEELTAFLAGQRS